MPHKPRRLKVLFLHGFASSPRELKPLGQRLYRSGFHVVAPLIPGHGERQPGMDSCTIEDWEEAVTLTYDSLHRDGSPVAIVGYCLGGVLGLLSASELNPRALVCLSTPVSRLEEEHFPVLDSDTEHSSLSTEALQNDCRSAEALRWRRRGCHPSVTTKFFATYQDSIALAAERVHEVRCPVLLVGGRRSSIVPHTDLAKLNRLLPEQLSVKRHCAPLGGHAVVVDHGRREIYRLVNNFLNEIDESANVKF